MNRYLQDNFLKADCANVIKVIGKDSCDLDLNSWISVACHTAQSKMKIMWCGKQCYLIKTGVC